MVERKWTKKGWTDGSGSGMVLFNKLMKRLNIQYPQIVKYHPFVKKPVFTQHDMCRNCTVFREEKYFFYIEAVDKELIKIC